MLAPLLSFFATVTLDHLLGALAPATEPSTSHARPRPRPASQDGDSGGRVAPSASTTAGTTPTQNIARQSPLALKTVVPHARRPQGLTLGVAYVNRLERARSAHGEERQHRAGDSASRQ